MKTKSIHIPLPVAWHEKLRSFANISNQSATEIVRQAIITYITEEEKKLISEDIRAFAKLYGGSDLDLLPGWEEASSEDFHHRTLQQE